MTQNTDGGGSWKIERVVTDRDLEAVLEIEALSFTNPWTREMYLREMDNPRVSHIYIVRVPAGDAEIVAGFCSFWLVFDELHINNLAIHPAQRRRGIATALLEHAMRTAAQLGARRATLEVRRSNEDARRIYEKLGFETAGIRRNYYAHPTEDALILWRPDLPDARQG